MTALLEAKNLSVTYTLSRTLTGKPKDTLAALKGASFVLKAGETLGIVGESGSGKTTLAKSILGLVPPTSGELLYKGKALPHGHWPRALRPKRQIVFQDPRSSLDPRMKVGRIIEESLRIHGQGTKAERRERMEKALAEVGLPTDAGDRFPHEFSGGQRQRIAIARTLVLEPEILILDEPTSALDVTVQARVLDLLLDLQQRRGLAYILISHDIGVVSHLSDQVVVMRAGAIVETGSVAAVIDAPSQDYTRKLINAVPTVGAA